MPLRVSVSAFKRLATSRPVLLGVSVQMHSAGVSMRTLNRTFIATTLGSVTEANVSPVTHGTFGSSSDMSTACRPCIVSRQNYMVSSTKRNRNLRCTIVLKMCRRTRTGQEVGRLPQAAPAPTDLNYDNAESPSADWHLGFVFVVRLGPATLLSLLRMMGETLLAMVYKHKTQVDGECLYILYMIQR